MAATTLVALMDGIQTRITGLGVNINVPLTDDNMPVALIGLPSIPDYHGSFGHGTFLLEPTITVFFGRQISEVGLRQLAALADIAGTSSIHAAIEGDRSLGTAVDDCIVASFRALDASEINHYGFVGGVFTLKVAARGK